MGEPSIFISNGTCYSAAGEKLDKSFIPCGNAAFGHRTCCGAGDNCLDDKSCFGIHGSGYGSYLTYMAGCTDPDYEDESCPDKQGIDQAWIGLTRCDQDERVWAACSQKDDPATLQPGSFCSCTDMAKATIAFTDQPTIPNTASLPQGTGSSVQFFAGYVPTPPGTTIRETTTAQPPPPLTSKQSAPPSASSPPPPSEGNTPPESTTPETTPSLTPPSSSSSQPGDPSSAINTTPTTGSGSGAGSNTGGGTSSPSNTSGSDSSNSNPSNPNTNSSSSSGLSSAAKAGIGVGAAVAALIFLAVIVALVLHHRRKRRRNSISPDTEPGAAATTAAGGTSSKHTSLDHPPSEISEADGRAARPWSMRSELEGSAVPSVGGVVNGRRSKEEGVGEDWGALSPIAELPGSVPPPGERGGGEEEGRRRVMVNGRVVYL